MLISYTHSGWSPGQGQYIMAGGSLSFATIRIYDSLTEAGGLPKQGTGRFVLDCDGANVPLSISGTTFDMQAETNELKVILNSSGNVPTTAIINVTTMDLGGSDNYLVIDDSAAATLTYHQTTRIALAGTLSNYSDLQVMKPDGIGGITANSDWEIWDDPGVSGDLSIRCLVPEPATMSLLVLGGLGVLIRRRRK